MKTNTEIIQFELHLTIGELAERRISQFVDLCLVNTAKPLLIELSRGEQTSQPMFNKIVCKDNLKEVLMSASEYIHLLGLNGFPVRRLKIEIPSEDAHKI